MFYSELKTAQLASHFDDVCAIARSDLEVAVAQAAYWQFRFGKPVSYVTPKTPILILNSEENFHQVLIEDRMGWIIYHSWIGFEELNNVRSRNTL